MIIGVGTDITEVERIKKAIEKNNFENRFFTDAEINYMNKKVNKYETAAGIFAGKEAVVKALGTGFSSFSFKDVEITHNEQGKPGVKLSGNAASLLEAIGGSYIHISISHEKKYATAVAIAEGV